MDNKNIFVKGPIVKLNGRAIFQKGSKGTIEPYFWGRNWPRRPALNGAEERLSRVLPGSP